MNKETLFEKFKNAYPFIYKLGNQYYYIGFYEFRECNEDEIENYEKFNIEFEKVSKLKLIEAQEVVQLNQLYKLVIKNDMNMHIDSSKENEIKKNIYNWIYSLSDEDIDDLDKQQLRFITAMNYYDGVFSRE